jgi:hypothetical protein
MSAVRVDSERRDRDPGHRQLDRPATMQEAVAKDRHHVRNGRQSEVALQPVDQTGCVAASGRQGDVSVVARRTVSDALGVAAEVMLATPPVAAARHRQAGRHKLRTSFKLVVEPVRNRRSADGYPDCHELVLDDRDLSELDAQRVCLHPRDRAASLSNGGTRRLCHSLTRVRTIYGDDPGRPSAPGPDPRPRSNMRFGRLIDMLGDVLGGSG